MMQNHRRLNPINSQGHQLSDQGEPAKKKRGMPPKKKLDEEIIPARPCKGIKQKATEQLQKRKPGKRREAKTN